jgi:hypothetical protein
VTGPDGPLPGGFVTAVHRVGDTVRRDWPERADRRPLVDRILRWQEDCRRGIEAGVAAGDPRFERLRDAGAVESVRVQQDWTRTNHAVLERALR